MKKVIVTLVETKHVVVNCEENDIVDIKAGGPSILGFDFYVDVDENMEDIMNFIKKELEKNKLPLVDIYVAENKRVEEKDLWTRRKIIKCIKKGY